MREIKFRAWDTKHTVMIEGPTVYDNADHLGISLHDAGAYYSDDQLEGDDNHIYGGDDWIFIMNDFELMQFTGLTDKNGKDIYEGDILAGFTEAIGPMKVVFEDGSFCACSRFGKWGLLYKLTEPRFQEMKPVEVIGNIYENKNLPDLQYNF